MDKSLSNLDINRIVGHPVKMVTYPQLANYDDIYDLLDENGECVILYQTSGDYGHWTCVFERDNGNIETFDSYGYEPDEMIELMRPYFRESGKHLYPNLSYLLLKSNKDIEYNNHKLQGAGTVTCGRHVAWRLRNKHLTADQYYNTFKRKNKDI